MQGHLSSQGEVFANAAGNAPLLAAWGSQDHASCQLLLSPGDMTPLSLDASGLAVQQLGGYLASSAASTAGGADQGAPEQVGLHGVQAYSDPGSLQHQQPPGLKALVSDNGLQPQSWQPLQWHKSQQQAQQHMQLFLQHQQPQEDSYHSPSDPLPYPQQQQQHAQQSRQLSPSKGIPSLDLSRVKVGSSQPVKNLPDDETASAEVAAKDAELCFDAGSIRAHHLHPDAPLQDSRCYIYRAVSRKELSDFESLLARLPPRERADVTALWDALLVARHDCEVMAARGVRVSRDISRDWQETVSDLIDKVVAQDNDLAQLRQQLKCAQAAAQQAAAAAAAASGSDGGLPVCGVEGLHAQLVRLKRHRDRLSRDQQELKRTLAESQQATQVARQEAALTREQLDTVKMQAQHLRDQHASLLLRNLELATLAECLEAQVHSLEAAAAAAAAGSGSTVQRTAKLALAEHLPGVHVASYSSSGGGMDQPKQDQTSSNPPSRSPAVAKAGVQAVKGSGRASPFAAEADRLDSISSDGRSSPANNSGRVRVPLTPVHQAVRPPSNREYSTDTDTSNSISPATIDRTGLVAANPSFLQPSKMSAVTASSNAATYHHGKVHGTSNTDYSTTSNHSYVPVLGMKGMGPMVWGSGGGASQTGSSGGTAACGRSSLGLGSHGGSSTGGTQAANPAGPEAGRTTGMSSSMPRNSDDTLGSSRTAGMQGYTNFTKEVDQYDQQVLVGGFQAVGGLQTAAPISVNSLGGSGMALAPNPAGVSIVYGHPFLHDSIHMPFGGSTVPAKPHSRLMFQQRVVGVVPSVLPASGQYDWQREIELTRQQLEMMESLSFV